MNYRETVRAIAQRLPHRTQRDVAEMLDIMRDIWLEELCQPGATIILFDLGTLSIDVQDMRTAGAVRQTMQSKQGKDAPQTVRRVYGRFRPSPALRRALKEDEIR
ncbi:MAG TPA: hypothetical protein PKD09_15225 [Aggregatilinea sp.]|uniref:hypothetical protein n=1 Tax=Aggregatilinea sp. TaxID=2806333 RepID=UPI002C5B5697|nr:hypothetical protein [Aggregatilinea sp.]HML23003.1 hypothetical protein [Aggregatilinea sp.]